MERMRAAEIVLGGVEYIRCTRCNGTGRRLKTFHGVTALGSDDCLKCKGTKRQISARFRKACRRMGLKSPKQPWERIPVRVGEPRTGRMSSSQPNIQNLRPGIVADIILDDPLKRATRHG